MTDSVLDLELQLSRDKSDAGAFTVYKWPRFGGRNIVTAVTPWLPSPFVVFTPIAYIRAKATIAGTSAQFVVSVLASAIDAPPSMRGAAYFFDTGEVTVATTATVILNPHYVGDLASYGIYVGNKTGGAALTDCDVEWAPEENSWDATPDYGLTSTDGTTYTTLAAGANAKVLRDRQEDVFVSVRDATVAAATTTARCWLLGTYKG